MNFNEIKTTLNNEFIGREVEIDGIINFIELWTANQQYQQKPQILNLWGMTRTGKTALLHRTIELMQMQHIATFFDMGNNIDDYISAQNTNGVSDNEFRDILIRTAKLYDKIPTIIVFDEMQFSTAIVDGFTNTEDPKRMIWELFDTGKICNYTMRTETNATDEGMLKFLEMLRNASVKINSNMWIAAESYSDYLSIGSTQKVFAEQKFSIRKSKSKKIPTVNPTVNETLRKRKMSFIAKWYRSKIQNYYWRFENKPETKTYKQYTAQQIKETTSIEVMYKKAMQFVYAIQKPVIYDLSKSLIFVVGNLDEVFPFANVFEKLNPEILVDANRNITLSDVKATLLKYFRPEQIARLGDNHIVYRVFSPADFRKAIDIAVEAAIQKAAEQYKMTITVTTELKDYFYSQIVPAQGMEQIKRNIENYFDSKLFQLKSNTQTTQHTFDAPIQPQTALTKHEIALLAVHEAGHIVAALYKGILPKYAMISTEKMTGYTYISPQKVETRKSIEDQVCILYGGYCAELVIFDTVSSGSKEDIEKLTYILSDATNNWGYNEFQTPAKVVKESSNQANMYLNDEKIKMTYNQRLSATLTSSFEDIKHIFYSDIFYQKKILQIAQYLVENKAISHDKIKQIYTEGITVNYDRKLSFVKETPFGELLEKTVLQFGNVLQSEEVAPSDLRATPSPPPQKK